MNERPLYLRQAKAICRAKINLFLDITGRREDGYHELETVMQSVTLADLLTVTLTDDGRDRLTVCCLCPDFPAGDNSTVHKAFRAFLEYCPGRLSTEIALEKRIPSCAGLGGGSADAAGTLAALSLLTGCPATEDELYAAAASVGADVPFCLSGGRRICRGTGEIISEPLGFDPDGGTVLIAKPERGIPTADAFRLLDRMHDGFARGGSGRLESFLETVSHGRPAWEMRPYNVFEEVLPELCPESEKMIKLLRELTPAAALTGSGSAVFGIFPDSLSAATARDRLESEFPGAFTVLTSFAERGAEARADDSIYYQ